MQVKLLRHTPDIEQLVANAGRLCYSSLDIDGLFEKYSDEENSKMIAKLMELGHESPIEHATFTFGVEGVSRALTHQLVRHRIASYSQQSQRYVKLDSFEYIIPPNIARNENAKRAFLKAMKTVQEAYNEISFSLIEDKCKEELERQNMEIEEDVLYSRQLYDLDTKRCLEIEKEAIEDARYVFPNACETKIVFTMNARTLLNFFRLRTCNRAQWEIREMADKMLIECKKIAPNLFKYAGASCMHGKCTEGKMTCGNPREPLEDF